jgi:transcriptional regulator with XRE-family HTH domain
MKDRITQFLKSEKISPAEFADKINVQRSSVSHVLNGRNYPSASFIQKMLSAYPQLNSRWLLLGEGTILEELRVSNLALSQLNVIKSPEEAEIERLCDE